MRVKVPEMLAMRTATVRRRRRRRRRWKKKKKKKKKRGCNHSTSARKQELIIFIGPTMIDGKKWQTLCSTFGTRGI